MAWIAALLSVAALALTSCAGGPRGPVQSYPGAERPRSEVAFLQATANARVVGIDGARVSGRSFTLLPGEHEVWIDIAEPHGHASSSWLIWSHCRVSFDAEAGASYQSRLRTRPAPTSHSRQLEPGITDAEGVLLTPADECSRFEQPDLEG